MENIKLHVEKLKMQNNLLLKRGKLSETQNLSPSLGNVVYFFSLNKIVNMFKKLIFPNRSWSNNECSSYIVKPPHLFNHQIS